MLHYRIHHTQPQAVIHCKRRNLGWSSAEGRSSTTKSETQAAVLLGMNRCGIFPLDSAPHSLFSIWTDLKRSENVPGSPAWRWGEWIWLTGPSGHHRNSVPSGVYDHIRDPEIPITHRPRFLSSDWKLDLQDFWNIKCSSSPPLSSFKRFNRTFETLCICPFSSWPSWAWWYHNSIRMVGSTIIPLSPALKVIQPASLIPFLTMQETSSCSSANLKFLTEHCEFKMTLLARTFKHKHS